MIRKFPQLFTIFLTVLTALTSFAPTSARLRHEENISWSSKDVARAAGFTVLETVGTVIDYGEA